MNTAFLIAIIIAVLLTVVSLGIGVFSMVKGPEFRKKYANRLMRARVIFQGLAIGLLFLALNFQS